MFKQTNPSS